MKSGMKKVQFYLVLGILALFVAHPLFANESESTDQQAYPSFGGPDAVPNLLESDRADKDVLFESTFLESYFDWKAGIKEKKGLSFGTGYTSIFLTGNEPLPETQDYSFGGMLRIFGTWELAGRGTGTTGTLSFKMDHRHKYADIALANYSLTGLGYVDSFASTFNDQGWRLTNLHWRQGWNHGGVVVMAGFLSAPDFIDIYTLGSPWLHFMGLSFTTGCGTIRLPGDAALGVIGAGWLTKNLYLMAGFEDANSLSDDPFKGFDTFVNDNEYFKHLEIGWTTSRDRAYLDNFHLMMWHADKREEAGVAEGWGGVLSFTHYIGSKWMPFVRAAYSEDGASLMERSVNAGLAFQPNPIGDAAGNLLGLGLQMGAPNETLYGSGLDDQYGMELFYRLQVTRELAITPDIQFLKNPALNPGVDDLWVFGLRARLAL
jgi:porin